MATSVRYRSKIPTDFDERIYAGILGKLMGIGLGRRYLGDARTPSSRELGRIGYDLASRGNFSPYFAEDGVGYALTMVRALEDFGCSSGLTREAVIHTLFNYAVENRSVLWWGGVGHSAAHTAYLKLKRDPAAVHQPEDSIVSEQSGAETCAEVWGMLYPSEPVHAAELAGIAARVAHDGAAVHAAQAVAAWIASAFSRETIGDVLSSATQVLPPESPVSRLICDICDWQAGGEAWQHTRERILEKYSDTEFGERHVVPHFAGVVLALAGGEGDAKKSFSLAAAAGWGTAANLGLIGCVLGVKNGMVGVDACPAWRGAISDRLYIPSADAGRCVTDAASEALAISRIARELQRVAFAAPKKGARFHFELPGSTQGFMAEASGDSPGLAMLRNVTRHSRAGKRCLALIFSGVDAQRCARVAAGVFPPLQQCSEGHSNFMAGSPTLYPGQMIRAYVEANSENKCQAGIRPFIRYLGENDEPRILRGPEKWLLPDARHEFNWRLPPAHEIQRREGTLLLNRSGTNPDMPLLQGRPIVEAGVEIFSDEPAEGVIYLDYFTWDGAPSVDLGPPPTGGKAWQSAWVNVATQCDFGKGASTLRVCQNEGTGMLIQGTRCWTDYRAMANVTPRMARAAGIAVRVQGLRRYYALLLEAPNKIKLVKNYYGTTVLAERDFPWRFGQPTELALGAEGKKLRASANGVNLIEVEDSGQVLDGGAFALVVDEGCAESGPVHISTVD